MVLYQAYLFLIANSKIYQQKNLKFLIMELIIQDKIIVIKIKGTYSSKNIHMIWVFRMLKFLPIFKGRFFIAIKRIIFDCKKHQSPMLQN